MASIKDLWKTLKPEPFCPHPNQEKAILLTKGPLYLPAGPGAGKTRVLLWRTVNLIAFQGVRPEEIFLATFTEKAALQLKEGLRSLLDVATEITGVTVTPTLLIFNSEGILIWHCQGTLSIADRKAALRAVDSGKFFGE
jgi:hypothetical protein